MESEAAHAIAASLTSRLNLADERGIAFIGIYAEDFQVVKHRSSLPKRSQFDASFSRYVVTENEELLLGSERFNAFA